MRIALFNDTGQYPHVGCRAVSSGHNRMLARMGAEIAYRSFYGEWKEITTVEQSITAIGSVLRQVDAVVVNGEGTIHHGRGRHLMAILSAAQQLKRPTYLVNAVLQACDGDLDTFQHLTGCTVRDQASSDYLTRLGVRHRMVFDSMVEADFAKHPSVDLIGQVIVTDWHGARASDVGAACADAQASLGARWYPLEDRRRSDYWRHALADIRSAQLVVTGRHHGVCLAAMAGVPFVACGSNTWKVEGLLSWMPGGLKTWRPGDDLIALCRSVLESSKHVFTEIQQWVRSQRPLTTFADLRVAA